jgi:hypothetical protein
MHVAETDPKRERRAESLDELPGRPSVEMLIEHGEGNMGSGRSASAHGRRQWLKASGALALSPLMAGCVTQALFKNHEYDESVSSVLISSDRKHLVFVGKDYHYIFDTPDVLVATLDAPFHHSVSGQLRDFHVKANGEITGDFSLILSVQVPEDEKRMALAQGYRKSEFRAGEHAGQYACEYEGRLVGTRYRSNGVQAGTSRQLNHAYSVHVSAEQTGGEKAALALLTPITVTADGVLILGAVPLVLIAGGVLMSACSNGCH